MASIISLIIQFLNIIKKFLYTFESFLLRFLSNDSNPPSLIDTYSRFKIHPLTIVEPNHLHIPFHNTKVDYALNHNKQQLKSAFKHKSKIYPSRGIA